MNYEDFNWDGITYGGAHIKALFDYVKEHPFKNGLEVGFDQGASALAFLRACPEARLLSLDIDLCGVGNARVRTSEVTSRFSFRCCDSREVLPSLEETYGPKPFDFIYIDGDHLYDAVKQDLFNADKLLADGGYMIVDDANPNHEHFGVGKAVAELCAERGYQKWDLAGSPSEPVILRRI